MKNKVIQIEEIKYLQLKELGSKLNLSFSCHEIIADKIIGLDEMERKLVVIGNNDINQIHIISLDEVSSISKKKIYNSIKPGELKKKKVYEFLKSIFLQFDFDYARETIVLSFYEKEKNNVEDLPGLERKVKNWQLILSEMIGRKNNKLVQKKRQLSWIG